MDNKNQPYSLESYNPDWVFRFNAIKKNLEEVFGEKAIAIEHVGSTAIVGMKSKPIIDALVIVSKMEPFNTEKEKMAKMGYKWIENYIAPETIVFFKEGENGQKTENVHICKEGSTSATQFLSIRDYLKTHPDRATAYGKLKEELNKKYPNDYSAYRAGKQDFLREIEKLARG